MVRNPFPTSDEHIESKSQNRENSFFLPIFWLYSTVEISTKPFKSEPKNENQRVKMLFLSSGKLNLTPNNIHLFYNNLKKQEKKKQDVVSENFLRKCMGKLFLVRNPLKTTISTGISKT